MAELAQDYDINAVMISIWKDEFIETHLPLLRNLRITQAVDQNI
jgi:hypothetical protein